jgi:hypothetical protein
MLEAAVEDTAWDAIEKRRLQLQSTRRRPHRREVLVLTGTP